MPEYKKYPRFIWDYIKDLPYMPSRKDREKLFSDKEKYKSIYIDGTEYTRVQLWDYFFRIKPKDVGKPQRQEISAIKKAVKGDIEKCKKTEKEIREKTKQLEIDARRKAVIRFILGCVTLGITMLFISNTLIIEGLSNRDKYIYGILFLLACLGILGLLVSIGYIYGYEKRESRQLASKLNETKKEHFRKANEAKKRIFALKNEINRLKRQVPKPLSGEEVRKCLDREFEKLWQSATKEVALDRELVEIKGHVPGEKANNPIPILGPGELQFAIPKQFNVKLNPDSNKHLVAKRVYPIVINSFDKYDILYAVYFIEYIIVAVDMLIIYSLYYDFIDGKVSSEHITEQYYKDVVTLSIVRDFRVLVVTTNIREKFYIEDAPTFMLSVSSGEKHRVTFVSEDYFVEIRRKIGLSQEEVSMIHWIKDAQKVANNAIKALRHHLRQHKTKTELTSAE